MTSVFIIEEHHEAFFIWNYAIVNQIISKSRNMLLHVDDHADMRLPTLRTSLKEVRQGIQSTLFFTRNQLSISDFILPAVYQGIFNEISWMSRGRKFLKTEQYLNVVSYKGEGRILSVTDNFLRAGIFNPDRKAAVFRQIDSKDSISASGPVILDIDLDFFCCDQCAGEMWEVQVTENEYVNFIKDPYHRLRIKFGGRLRAEQREGNYYFVYQPCFLQNQPEISQEKVSERTEQFVNWLQDNNIHPVLIDVCRSRFSKYTPPEYWQWLEEMLLKKLEKLFPVTVKHLNELIEEERLLNVS